MGSIVWMSFLSGLSTPLGAWLVVRFYSTLLRIQGLFWGIAAGIMTTLVLIELMPSAIRIGGHRLFVMTALAACLLMFLVQKAVAQGTAGYELTSEQTNFLQMGWFVAVAIALHDLPEGIAIAAGGAVNEHTGIVIALAIALHNVPEGMSIAFPLALAGVNGTRIIRLSIWIGLVTPVGALVSIWLIHFSSVFIAGALALASGTMVFVVSQDILPEALRLSKGWTIIGVGAGGALMLALSLVHV